MPEALDLACLPSAVPLRFTRERVESQSSASESFPNTPPPPPPSFDPFSSSSPSQPLRSATSLSEHNRKKRGLFGKAKKSSPNQSSQFPDSFTTPPNLKKRSNWLSKLSSRRGSGNEEDPNLSLIKSIRNEPAFERPLDKAQQKAQQEAMIESKRKLLHREAYDSMFGSIPISGSSVYPLNSKTSPKEVPITYSAYVDLYRVGGLDLSDPPSIPFQDPAARASGIFTRIKDKDERERSNQLPFPTVAGRSGTRFVDLSRPKTMDSSFQETSNDTSASQFVPRGSFMPLRPRTAEGSVGQKLSPFNAQDGSSPSISPLRPLKNALQLTGCSSDEEGDEYHGVHKSSSDGGKQEVWEIVTSDKEDDRDRSDGELDLESSPLSRDSGHRFPSISSGRPSSQSLSPSFLAIKRGMRAPRPIFEMERQAEVLLYNPKKFTQAVHEQVAPSLMPESPLITRSLADEFLEKETDQAQVEGLGSKSQGIVEQLCVKMGVPGARFILLDDEEMRVVARSDDGGLGSNTTRERSFEVGPKQSTVTL